MDWHKLIDGLVPSLGEAGVKMLKDKLESLSAGTDEPWKKAVLAMTGDAVAKYGPKGIEIAREVIDKLIEGKQAPDISWMDLQVASDILAEMQNAEADRKSAAKDFLTQVGEVLSVIFSAIAKGVLTSL